MSLTRTLSSTCAGVAVVLWLTPGSLIAQAPPSSPVALPRADASATVGWFNATVERPDERFADGDSWFHDAASLGLHAGYYWTENLKLEASAAWAGTGRAWSGAQLLDPAGRPFYRSTEHTLTTRTLSAALIYQFGHNLSVHPFVGAGVDLDFLRDHRRSLSYGDPVALYPPPSEERVSATKARLLALAGVKAYLSERLFVRADVQAAAAGTARKVVPRIGLGFDF